MILKDNYTHGGDIYRNKVRLDFSANVNPLGTPGEVKAAVAASADAVDIYPDPYCGKLRELLAEREGVLPQEIICGNGASELIFQFAAVLKPRKALLPVPAFSEYESALKAAGCSPEYIYLSRAKDYAPDESILEHIEGGAELIMLCNPGNPAGKLMDKKLLEAIVGKCRSRKTWLFIDECFMDFVPAPKAFSAAPRMEEEDRIFLLKAFTKMYGMAGLRLGYGLCRNGELLAKMCRISQPWNVSGPAQAAGAAALCCEDFREKSRKMIETEKSYITKELRSMGLSILEGEANFFMILDFPGLYAGLLKKGILIRDCGNYRGLKEGDCRIAVRRREENLALLEAIKEIIDA